MLSVGSMKLESNGRFLFRASSLALHITQIMDAGNSNAFYVDPILTACGFDKARLFVGSLLSAFFVSGVRLPKVDHWNSYRHFWIDLPVEIV